MARKSGKGKRVSGKERRASGKRRAATSGRRKAVSGKGRALASGRAKPKKKARAAIMALGTGAKVDLICRECHEEWSADVDAARAQEAIACPICEHRARAPSDDVLHQIKLYKGMEMRSLKGAIASVLVAIVSYATWLVLTHDGALANEPAVFYGPLAVSAIAFFSAIFFAARYERSRWETYF